jgi:hypothetical protein
MTYNFCLFCWLKLSFIANWCMFRNVILQNYDGSVQLLLFNMKLNTKNIFVVSKAGCIYWACGHLMSAARSYSTDQFQRNSYIWFQGMSLPYIKRSQCTGGTFILKSPKWWKHSAQISNLVQKMWCMEVATIMLLWMSTAANCEVINEEGFVCIVWF